MTREQHLLFCRVCKRQQMDISQGLVCSLTGMKADFEEQCNFYDEDATLVEQYREKQLEEATNDSIAGKGLRFTNFILDWVFFVIFSFIVGIILGIYLAFYWPEGLDRLDELGIFANYIMGFVVGMIYYTFFESLTGRTPAKYITRTKVLLENGKKPPFKTILLRSLYRFIPFEAFSFLGSGEGGLHDTLSKTIVVRHQRMKYG